MNKAICTGCILLVFLVTACRHNGNTAKDASTFFKIYGANRQLTREEINFHVTIPDKLPLQEKVTVLADSLSRFKFDNLPVVVKSISNENGKKIAHVDLQELPHEYICAPSWEKGYLQGSAGAHFTRITLVKTLLQPDYRGRWIDGLSFSYNSKPMTEWSHIDLSGVIYRSDIR